MSKVGIVTVYGENNYGNKLQNFAVVRIFEELGYTVETLQVFQSALQENYTEKCRECIKTVISWLPFNSRYKNIRIRKENFKRFSIEYLKLTKKGFTKDAKKYAFHEYDILSVGSDQVWNDHDFNLDDVMYYSLGFMNGCIKISFAPSIGKKGFSKEYQEVFCSNISNFNVLNCREIQGAEYLSSLIGKEVEIWPDPTLLVGRETWNELSRRPEWIKENEEYTLIYCLGKESINYINKLNLTGKLVDLLDMDSISYTASPSEFIYLIAHAEHIYTDSFHACVFSMIFGKKYTVVRRIDDVNNDMTSRIDTLFRLFHVQGAYDDMITPIFYQEFDSIRKKLADVVHHTLIDIPQNWEV